MPTRRLFLQGAALTAAAVPLSAQADDDRLRATVRELSHRAGELRQAFLDSMYEDRPAAADRPLHDHIHDMGAGFAAMSTVKDLGELPVGDQAHPAVQALLVEALTAIGAATVRSRELIEAFLAEEDPGRETHLRAGLRGVRLSLGDWQTSLGRQAQIEGTLARSEGEPPGALLRQMRRSAARIRKAEKLAMQLAEAGDDTGILNLTDPEVLAAVEAGRERWGAECGGASGQKTWMLVLGFVVMGVGCTLGGFIALVGLCVAACGSPAGIFALIGGLAIIGLSIWGGLTLVKAGKKSGESAENARFGPAMAEGTSHVAVLGEDGWVDAGVSRGVTTRLLVRGTGLVRVRGAWMADADGNGEAAGLTALVPGAPLGALVGKVGDDVFFLGSEGVVPEGPDGPLALAINQAPGAPAPRGHFVAEIARYPGDVV